MSRVKSVITLFLIFAWLELASLLSKSFSSVLLNTYFSLQSIPVVNTLRDVIDNKQLSIAASNAWFSNVILPRIPSYEQADFKNRFMPNSPSVLTPEVFNELVNGRTVLISNTYVAEMFLEQWKRWNELFIRSEHKYGANFLSFHSRKKLPIRNLLKFL